MVALTEAAPEAAVEIMTQILDQLNANDHAQANQRILEIGEGRPVAFADPSVDDCTVVCAAEMETVADGAWMDISEKSEKALEMSAGMRAYLARIQDGAIGFIVSGDAEEAEAIVIRWSDARGGYVLVP